MDVDPQTSSQSQTGPEGDGRMLLPQELVANAPYTGVGPTPPNMSASVWNQPVPIPKPLVEEEEPCEPCSSKSYQRLFPALGGKTWIPSLCKRPGESGSEEFGQAEPTLEQTELQTTLSQFFEDIPTTCGTTHVLFSGRESPFSLNIEPSMANAAFLGLTAAQLSAATDGGKQQSTTQAMPDWEYKLRYNVQRVVDHVYLGPYKAVCDTNFLREEGITMLVGVRDSRQASMMLMQADRAVREMGLVAHFVDVDQYRRTDLIGKLVGAIRAINDHILSVPNGRVVVFCETGNGRSAAVVAAYLMAMYNLRLIEAVQYITAQRFCSEFDEDTKRMLVNFADILQANRDVNNAREDGAAAPDGNGAFKRRMATVDRKESEEESEDQYFKDRFAEEERKISEAGAEAKRRNLEAGRRIIQDFAQLRDPTQS